MNVIVHQYPGMYRNTIAVRGIAQALVQKLKVLVTGQDRIAVVAANHRMLWLVGQE